MLTFRTNHCAHVKDPVVICRKRLALSAVGLVTQKYCIHKVKPPMTECGCPRGKGNGEKKSSHNHMRVILKGCTSCGRTQKKSLNVLDFFQKHVILQQGYIYPGLLGFFLFSKWNGNSWRLNRILVDFCLFTNQFQRRRKTIIYCLV